MQLTLIPWNQFLQLSTEGYHLTQPKDTDKPILQTYNSGHVKGTSRRVYELG